MSSKQIHSSFTTKMQRLRTIRTQLERLRGEDITADASVHAIVQDIRDAVQDLLARSAP
jgi:hypothetical protein